MSSLLLGALLRAVTAVHVSRKCLATSVTCYKSVKGSSTMASIQRVPRVVVRSVSGEDHISLSFSYANLDLSLKERQFNFHRNRNEALDSVTARIATSIACQIEKKLKRKKRREEKRSAAAAAADDCVPSADAIPASLKVSLLQVTDGMAVAGDTPCFNAFVNGSELHVGSAVYQVVVNPPTVRSIILPTNIMVGFPVRPKMAIEFASVRDCAFSWYRSMASSVVEGGGATAKLEWEPVGSSSYEYVPAEGDIEKRLRVVCHPRSFTVDGDQVEAISKTVVSAGPGRCPFDDRHAFTMAETGRGSFRFVSYNILADLYADSDFSREVLFPYCPPPALDIDYRKQLLLKEITGYNADVICLQEVDGKVFDKDLQPTLRNKGMDGLFHLKGGQVAEGLACFYRSSKFRQRHNQSLILGEEVQTNPLFKDFMAVLQKNEKLRDTFLQRTTALQVVVLESMEDPLKILCIGNTHLFFRPDRDNIRLLQAGMCVTYIEQMMTEEASKLPGTEVAVVICGDFNSTPPFGVYQLATSQFIGKDHADWSSNADEVVTDFSLSHSLPLVSACGTPPYTNFTAEFADCLDYIFIDGSKLVLQQVVPFPSEEELRRHTALPSVTQPSDHIALIADIGWRDLHCTSEQCAVPS